MGFAGRVGLSLQKKAQPHSHAPTQLQGWGFGWGKSHRWLVSTLPLCNETAKRYY